jgi:hypothetical protein
MAEQQKVAPRSGVASSESQLERLNRIGLCHNSGAE